MKTKTETVSVWLTDVGRANQIRQLPLHAFWIGQTNSTMDSVGWIKVGTAEITVTYLPTEQQIEKAAEQIREKMAEAAAKYQAMQTELQRRLNDLLAITNEVDA